MKGCDKIGWANLLKDIQDRLMLSQAEIAERCGVVRQSVSNWLVGYRQPGYHARRKLLELAKEAGIEASQLAQEGKIIDNSVRGRSIISKLSEKDKPYKTDKKYLALEDLYHRLSSLHRQEVIDFARFIFEKQKKAQQ